MKVGDQKAFQIDGIEVGNAKVTKMEGDVVTIEVPATRIEFKVRHVLTDETIAPENTGNQHIIDAPAPAAPPVPNANVEPAPAVTPASPAPAVTNETLPVEPVGQSPSVGQSVPEPTPDTTSVAEAPPSATPAT